MSKTSKSRKTALRKYRVLYAVARSEYYEVEATNAKEAEDKAFSDGQLVDGGETTNVDALEVEEIETTARDAFEALIQEQIAEHCALNHGSRMFRPAEHLLEALKDAEEQLSQYCAGDDGRDTEACQALEKVRAALAGVKGGAI
jgi:hypothetical protein